MTLYRQPIIANRIYFRKHVQSSSRAPVKIVKKSRRARKKRKKTTKARSRNRYDRRKSIARRVSKSRGRKTISSYGRSISKKKKETAIIFFFKSSRKRTKNCRGIEMEGRDVWNRWERKINKKKNVERKCSTSWLLMCEMSIIARRTRDRVDDDGTIKGLLCSIHPSSERGKNSRGRQNKKKKKRKKWKKK